MTSSGRIDYMDGLRGLAIVMVMSLHWLSWYSPFLHGGSIGVDIFFVLSGFIITTILWRGHPSSSVTASWSSFLRRRALRLYPALAGLVVGSVLLYAAVPGAALGPDEVARRGALVLSQLSSFWAASQAGSFWQPELHPFAQTWSLSVEWCFYVLWPLAVLGSRSRGVSAPRLAWMSTALAAVLYLASLPLGDFWFYFGPSARFAELLVGSAAALWFVSGGPRPTIRRAAGALAPAALATLLIISVLGPGADGPLYRRLELPAAVAATVVLVVSCHDGASSWVQRLLSHPWLCGLGRYSYSLYLWHLVPLLLLEDQGFGLPRPLVGLIVVVATVALTSLSFRWLEQPFLTNRNDVLGGSRTEHRDRSLPR